MGNILAIEKDGVVYVATDTVKEIDSMSVYHKSPDNIKIKALPSGVILGCLGSTRATQLVFAHTEWFKTDVLDKKYIVTEIVPKMYDEIKDVEEWKSERYDTESVGPVVAIIAKGSDIFVINQDLTVVKCKGYAAISYNSGDDMISAYLASSCEKDLKKLIKNAFKVGQKYNDSFFSSIAMINTREMKLEIIEDL